MILSNKYMSSHKHFDPDKAAWKRLVEVARARLSAVAQHSGRGPSPLGLGPVLAFTAGAILRYDATLLPLLGDLVALISDEQIGQTVARSLEVLVSPKACLSAENHAAIKPLYKQWAYAQLVKPNWTRSAPFNSKQPEASNFRIAILALLKHFPFEIYAEDVEKVCRVILSSMPKLEVGPDLEGALGLIFEILRNSPEELKGHLKTLIMGCVGIYTRANTTPASSPHNYGASCRKLALDLLAALPPKYEERYLLPHTAVLKRTLANACGDKVREVRQAAVDARVSWTNVT